MKPSLRIKVLILLGYVLLCTILLVQGGQPAEPLDPQIEAAYQ
ncbi:MAG: hypothetical protein V4693_12775 [Pseudomonadota bacterium]